MEVTNPARPSLATVAAPAPVAQKVYPSSGPELVAFVAVQNPERLAAGVGGNDRVAQWWMARPARTPFPRRIASNGIGLSP